MSDTVVTTQTVLNSVEIQSNTIAIIGSVETQVITAGIQGPSGPGVPVGGAVGQVLAKSGSADFATLWQSQGALAAKNAANLASSDVSGILPAAKVGPAGSSGQIQYNNAGALGAISGSSVSGSTAGFTAVQTATLQASSNLTLTSGFGSTILNSGFHVYLRPTQDINLEPGGNVNLNNGNFYVGSGGILNNGAGEYDLYNLTKIYNDGGSRIEFSEGDGSIFITNDMCGNFIVADGGGGVTVRGAGDSGGLYADTSGYTFLGVYSTGSYSYLDPYGMMVVAESSYPSTALQVGSASYNGAFVSFNGANSGAQTFVDVLSGIGGVSSSIRVFTDTQCGEFAAVGSPGEYFSNAHANDVGLKGDPGGANAFRIGVGSGNAQFNVENTLITLLAKLLLQASTTSKASLNIPSGSAPSSPSNGDIWYDGTNVKMRVGATTKTFTLV